MVLSAYSATDMRNKPAKHTRDGSEFSERRTVMSDTNSTSDDNRSLHEMLSEHLATCEKCQTVPMTPLALGQRDRHCFNYLAIIRQWANREGRVNNIVSHDEYGNEADSEYYLKGGKYILGSD